MGTEQKVAVIAGASQGIGAAARLKKTRSNALPTPPQTTEPTT
jgi:hypothetical protein